MTEMTQKTQPTRLRRVQLAVPGSKAEMLAKAAASAADYVFCDLEDAVAPQEKAKARATVCDALNGLDWGKKTRCVRVNDVGTPWCFEDIIAVVEGAGRALDVIMLPKPMRAADIQFADILLSQLEQKLELPRRIGLEVLIEEAAGMERVSELARATPRLEALIFGMGDYAASQGMGMKEIGRTEGYPGDVFHYARFHMTVAARAAGLDAVDGPFVDFKDDTAYREECRRAKMLGMVGKWAIHPNQIPAALEEFSPSAAEVAEARELCAAYEKAKSEGLGSVAHKGIMIDAASARLAGNIVQRAELMGL